MDISDIASGNVKSAFDLQVDLSEQRLRICKQCPLYSLNGTCNRKLYLNPKNGDVSTMQKSGYKKGCGCIINRKVKQKDAKCPVGKW